MPHCFAHCVGQGQARICLAQGRPKAQLMLCLKVTKQGTAGAAQELSTPVWVTSSLSPLCSGSELALGVCIGKPQPLLTFSLLPKQLQPQLLCDSWMRGLKTCGTLGLCLMGQARGAGEGGNPEPRGWGPQRGSGRRGRRQSRQETPLYGEGLEGGFGWQWRV